ncbi:MAG TPA: cytochrome c biogenesis protein, partial [Woeseiaceae bacterium]|nr:cytochrome c biogenesis protein [Woeseiaceae bacterium]
MGTLHIVHRQGLRALEGLVCCLRLQVGGDSPTCDDGKHEVESRRSRPLEFGGEACEFSALGAIGSALTLGLRRGSLLLGLLVMPLAMAMTFTWIHKLASPPHAYRIAGRLLPWVAWPAGILIAIGLYGGLVLAPDDYQQGDAFRIVYIHAPSAWLSMLVYGTMAVAAGTGLIWRIKLAHAVAAASAPIGASFT